MGLKFVNNSESTLASGIAAGATTLTVAAGHGARFPTIVSASGDFFFVTLVDVSGNREVIKVTEHQAGTDVFQVIERAADAIQNGTPTAYSFATDDVVQCRLPAVAILSPDSTKSTSFQVDSDNTGPRIKNNALVLEARNAADSAYANIKALGLTLTDALVIAGSITGVTSMVMGGALSGVTTLAMGGALSGATNIGMAGTLGTVTNLTITGTIATPTNITASGTVQAEHLYTTDDCQVDDDLTVNGKITSTAEAAAIQIDNETADVQIKARDHGTASTPEVVNVVYGTGSPPSAGTTPEGTLWFKYTA